MTQITDQMGQTQGQAQEVVGQAAQKVQEGGRQAMDKAGGQLRSQLDSRSTQAGEQVVSFGETLRNAGQSMRDEGKTGPAEIADRAASQIDRLGGYLRDADADRMVQDVESFARRQPWAVAGMGFVLGMAAARFLKASSERRYEEGLYGPTYGSYYEAPDYTPAPSGIGTAAGAGTTPGTLDTTPGLTGTREPLRDDEWTGGPSTPASL